MAFIPELCLVCFKGSRASFHATSEQQRGGSPSISRARQPGFKSYCGHINQTFFFFLFQISGSHASVYVEAFHNHNHHPAKLVCPLLLIR
jgi:hypothetical protein